MGNMDCGVTGAPRGCIAESFLGRTPLMVEGPRLTRFSASLPQATRVQCSQAAAVPVACDNEWTTSEEVVMGSRRGWGVASGLDTLQFSFYIFFSLPGNTFDHLS